MGREGLERPTGDEPPGTGEIVRPSAVAERWVALFEDLHGAGSYRLLLSLLEQPCVTFAAIAERFGVTRERVRQWQLALTPDGPRGHERQRLCGQYQQKRRLLEDALFRAFFQHARRQFDRGRIELLRSAEGYRRRRVRIDGSIVALGDVSRSARVPRGSGVRVYTLKSYGSGADFVYLRLADDDYLFLPADSLPAKRASFADDPASGYRHFKNTFGALQAVRRQSA